MDTGRALRARSHWQDGRIDDVAIPEWVAFAVTGMASTDRWSKDVAARGNLPDVLILHAILGQRFAQRVDVELESSVVFCAEVCAALSKSNPTTLAELFEALARQQQIIRRALRHPVTGARGL
jgi:hypothetical protein